MAKLAILILVSLSSVVMGLSDRKRDAELVPDKVLECLEEVRPVAVRWNEFKTACEADFAAGTEVAVDACWDAAKDADEAGSEVQDRCEALFATLDGDELAHTKKLIALMEDELNIHNE